MATKKETKKTTGKTTTPARDDTNVVSFIGTVKRIRFYNEKVACVTLDNVRTSPTGKAYHTFIDVKIFKPFEMFDDMELDEGDMIKISGSINTSTSEKDGKKYYNTFIVADDAELLGGD